MSFIHLHVQSAYSLLTSTISIEKLVAKTKNQKIPAVALTDRNVMYGAIEFYEECLKNKVKPIIGLVVDVLCDKEEGRSHPLVLLAKNNSGYQNLLKISSAVQTKSQKGIPLQWLSHYTKGLFALTPGEEGIIESCLLLEKNEEAKERAEQFVEMFEEDSFYLALQRDETEAGQALAQKIITLAKETDINLVATNRVSYLCKEDEFAQQCLSAIKDGGKISPEIIAGNKQTGERYLKSAEEMKQLFSDQKEALENSVRIAEKCKVTIELHRQLLPKYPLQDNLSSDELLASLCQQGMQARYKEVTMAEEERLAYELAIIQQMGFSDYFLIVWDFMKYAREQGILTGPGRGSAAGSIVAYVLYITDVDPLTHGLLFERFLNPERISMPDIDIDFPDHRRDEVIRYVVNKYGNLHVAQIITFGTFAAKAAARDVGRVFGLQQNELERLSKAIPSSLGITLQEALTQSEKLRTFVKESQRNTSLFEIACKIEGLPRHTSTHAAGVVVSEQPLVELVPIQTGSDDVYLTQFSMNHLETLGLLKMDFLGLKNLTLIESIQKSIKKNRNKEIDVKKLPLEDEATYGLLSKGDTSGIFQLESEGMQRVLTRLQPTKFEDIVAVNALYRPGPMDNISLYIDRKHGREKVTYDHPDLKPILKETHGVIVYQEQIIQIAAKMAGFTLGEADLLRRAVSKKQEEVLQKERRHFVQGALKRNYQEAVANTVYDLIVKFANYGFNRSHAVAYSMISYELAYLKTHYYEEFIASLLTSSVGNERKIQQYVSEMKERGLTMVPPSINRSGVSFFPDKDGIRYSLAAIKGIGRVALREIFSARREKKFTGLFDFCIRVPIKAVNRQMMEALIYSGCFDEFGKDRAVLLASLDVARQHAQLVQPTNNQIDELFSSVSLGIEPKYVEVDAMKMEEKLGKEKEVLGFYLSDHPLKSFERTLHLLEVTPLKNTVKSNQIVYISAFIIQTKETRTKTGETMMFLLISDESAEIDAVVFPSVYRKTSAHLTEGALVYLGGRVDIRNGRKQFVVEMCERLEDVIQEANQTLYIQIKEEVEGTNKLHTLKEILKQFHGKARVILHYESEKRTTQLPRTQWVKPSQALLEQLNDLLGEENIVLKK